MHRIVKPTVVCGSYFGFRAAGAVDEVHLRRPNEARDEEVARARVEVIGEPTCSMLPAFRTTILSAIVIASTWSWVT
jgi:hypothetical protein